MSLAESRVRVAVKNTRSFLCCTTCGSPSAWRNRQIRRQIRRAPKRVSEGRSELHSLWIRHAATGGGQFSGHSSSGTQVHHRPHERDCATGERHVRIIFAPCGIFSRLARRRCGCVKRTMPVCESNCEPKRSSANWSSRRCISGGQRRIESREKTRARTPAEIGTFEIPT